MMELPQARPFGTQGRKPTHDFLSLYSYSTFQQEPRPPSQGNHLKTHDFLQPLEERAERKSSAKDEGAAEEMSSVVQKTPPSVEHNILPGGIGTYSISHISSFKRNQRVLKPDAAGASLFTVAQASSTDRNDENSNCTSYSGSDFSLWEESAAVKQGQTGKENHVGDKPFMAESAAKLGQGQWTLSEQTSSFSNNHHNSFNSIRSSQTSGQKNQSLLEMLKSARDCNSQVEEFDNSEAFILKKESSSTQTGELRVRVDGKSTDQKPDTPRSKHSATEQRRRSKINDRFQMLRALIPHGEQKRDKASFLLEVIEYVQFLQEKVHKYERSYQGWNHQPEKSMPWRNDQRPAESYVDQSRGTNSGSGPSPTLLFASRIDDKNINISPTIPGSIHNVESGMSAKAMTIPLSSQQNFLAAAQSGGPAGGGVVSQLTHRLATDAEKSMYQPSVQCQAFSCATEMAATNDDKPKEKDLSIEGGAISISSVYSKGLLHTLTEALQSSGVDLSQASISVQIELGRQANIKPSPTLVAKEDVFPSRNKGMGRSRVARAEDSEQGVKKRKTCKS